MTVRVDFANGPVNSFEASGSPTYGRDGVSLTVSRGGDAPQLQSLFYIMFGRVEMTLRAAPGAGIVSSLVLQSDDLDEIDVEWLGAAPDEVQTNYFGKGRTTTYNRGQLHAVPGTQARWITYAVDWTADRIVWTADGRVLRELPAAQAAPDQYPQTPMQVKFGAWAGGDPAYNAPGTVAWARGPTDFAKGPFAMHVRSVVVADYSTGKEYRYKDTSGTWQSIEAVGGGAVNSKGSPGGGGGNPGSGSGSGSGSASGPAVTIAVPVGGMAKDGSSATATQTGWPWVATANPSEGSIPSGWYMTPNGKIMRTASAALRSSASLAAALGGAFALGLASFFARPW
ncbi:hypothetical protein UVI_02004320 [Ustilaginoidea virens]|nr:hypothetical protein UVI_02004320 [Ustilaginoidea virens]